MLRRMIPLVSVLFAGHGALALDTTTSEVLPYSDARKLLLERGFHPFVMPGASLCDEEGPRCYPELLGCKHKRHWICHYTWKSGISIYQAETNSDVPIVDSFYCLVNCAPAKEPEPVERR